MKEYFTLQFTMIKRQIEDFGVNPMVGLVLLPLVFIGLSDYIFLKSAYTPYIYAAIALIIAAKLSETSRNDFLKTCFPEKDYRQIRLLENGLVALPFVLFLLVKGNLLVAGALLLAVAFIALVNMDNKLNFTIPTPFFKRPFEFVVGFRKSFFVFFIIYFVAVMAIMVGNYELGIITLVITFFVCMSFYADPEGEYHVWIFALSPGRFLWRKISASLLFSTVLCLPIFIGMVVSFPEKVYLFLGVMGVGYAYLATTVLGKYATFPRQFGVPQAVLIGASLFFPPVLLGIAVFFYYQSVNRLKHIL